MKTCRISLHKSTVLLGFLLNAIQPSHAKADTAEQKVIAIQQSQIAALKSQVAALQPQFVIESSPNIVAVDPVSSSIRAAEGSSLTIQKVGIMCTAMAKLKIGLVEGPVYALGIDIPQVKFRPTQTGMLSAAVIANWAYSGGTDIYSIYGVQNGRIHIYRNNKENPVSFTSKQEVFVSYTYLCGQ